MRKDWIPVAAPAHLIAFNSLGRAAYQRQIDVFKLHDKDINPPWKEVRAFQQSITPKLDDMPGNIGKNWSYHEALKITIEQIMTTLSSPIPKNIEFHFKDGCDGSGSHSIYNQQGNHDTHNILLYMFTPLKLSDHDTPGSVLWREENPL